MVIEACRAMLTERFRLMCKQRGRQQVRSSLQQGRALSKAFLAVTELQSTRTWAYVPASRENDVSDDVAGSLASGGVFSPAGATSAWESSFSRLRAAHGLLIVEDELATPADPFLARFHGSFATNETDVFHWYTLREESAPAEVESFIHSRSSAYPLNAFLIDSPLAGLPTSLPSEFLENLVSSVDAVIVSAWDGESVAVCQVHQ
jgi:hypothetical protein